MAALFVCLPAGVGLAYELILPPGTTRIEEEAFYGDASLEAVTLPDGLEYIGPRAFACSGVTRITIPASVQYIAEDALENAVLLTSENGVIDTPKGSAAYQWAVERGYTAPLNGLLWEEHDGEITVTGISRAAGTLRIPERINGMPVTAVAEDAFYGRADLTGSFSLPETVRSIGAYAFCYCDGLGGELALPAGLKELGASAFLCCGRAEGTLTLPEGLTEIRSETFAGTGIRGLVLHDGVRTIGAGAFRGCGSLTGTVAAPASLATIGYGAFSGTGGVTLVFASGESLFLSDRTEPLWLPADSQEQCLTYETADGYVRITGAVGETVQLFIPETIEGLPVREIAAEAFIGTALTGDIIIPDSVEVIGAGAFRNQSSWRGHIVLGAGLREIGEYAFDGLRYSGGLVIPDSVETIGNYAFYGASGYGSRNTGTLTLGKGLRSIGAGAFGYSGLTGTLCVPEQVEKIDYSAFANNRYLDAAVLACPGSALQGSYLFDAHVELYVRQGSSAGERLTEMGRTYTAGVPLWTDTEFLSLEAGQQASIQARMPTNPEGTLGWTSSDEGVAAVENGVVTAKGAGEAVITVTGSDGADSAAAEVKVQVTDSGEHRVRVLSVCEANPYTDTKNLGEPLATFYADGALLAEILSGYSPCGYPIAEYRVHNNITRAELLQDLRNLAAVQTENDIAVVLLACHGASGVTDGKYAANLLLTNEQGVTERMTIGEFVSALKEIPGKVVVVLTSCGSGRIITEMKNAAGGNLIAVTSQKEGTAATAYPSTASDVLVWTQRCIADGDADGDGRITTEELGAYLYARAAAVSALKDPNSEHPSNYPQVWPRDDFCILAPIEP